MTPGGEQRILYNKDVRTPVPQTFSPTQGKIDFEHDYVKTVMIKYWNQPKWYPYGVRMDMRDVIDIEQSAWQHRDIGHVLQFIQPRRHYYYSGNRWAGAYVC